MKVTNRGLGYVGFTSVCCIASQGHRFIWIVVDADKVQSILDGRSPIVEPQVEQMLVAALDAGLMSAASSIGVHLMERDLALVCVGTPSAADGSHNMGHTADVTRQIAHAIDPARQTPLVVAYRSSFKPGTIEDLTWPLMRSVLSADAERLVRVVYTPEFLREGSGAADYFAPPKIVVGTASGAPYPVLDEINAGIDAPIFYVGYRESQITKFVDNPWHAVKVTFANEIGRACLALGISAAQMHSIFVSDTKWNISPYYLRQGSALGGSCLPKDVRARQSIGSNVAANLHLIDSLLRSSDAHKHRLFEYAREGLAAGLRIVVAGFAIKAGTDDLRESPNVDLTRRSRGSGVVLDIYEFAINTLKQIGANLGCADSQLPALEKLLIGRVRAAATYCDRVLACNATIEALSFPVGMDIRHRGGLP